MCERADCQCSANHVESEECTVACIVLNMSAVNCFICQQYSLSAFSTQFAECISCDVVKRSHRCFPGVQK